jgi:DNA-binding MarR family transcriptional regulator
MRSTQSTTELAEHLRTGVTRTARRLRQEADSGLSPTLAAALATIDRHGPLTPSEVADRERIKRPTATRLIARLEEQGYVLRAADPEDRRSSLISASAAGRALLQRTRERKDVFLARRLQDLPAEDRATLERAAQLLEQLLEDQA